MIRLAEVRVDGTIARCFWGEVADLARSDVREAQEPWAIEGANYDQAKVAHEAQRAAENARRNEIRNDARRLDLLARLNDATPTEIGDFVDGEVTTLAGARAMFKRILITLSRGE